ncbi:MAG: hypothetical protein IKN04_10380 [Clostridia bacterium]|nr:hypothetical protein [Clostridia bacterium]
MKKPMYTVTFRVYATFSVDVEASSPEVAVEEAEELFDDADFGQAENIDREMICVDDEKGNRIIGE